MHCSNTVFSILISVCYSFFCCAFATTVEPRTLEELANVAPVVVYGKVVQIDIDSLSGRRTAILEALEVAKGSREFKSLRDFYIPLFNRALPHSDSVEIYQGAPELRPGEEIVAFLRPIEPADEGPFRRRDGRRVFALQGLQQGKWRVLRDRAGVRRALSSTDWPSAAGLDVKDLHPKPPLRSRSRALSPGQELVETPPTELSRFRTLDSVLNLARGAP